MAVYAAAFEPRFRAVVSSQPGMAFAFTNHADPRYPSERLFALPDSADRHELLELLAPRPFLLIAGENADGDKSLPLLRRAAVTDSAKGKPEGIAVFNHRTGHWATAESVVAAMEWLRVQLSSR